MMLTEKINAAGKTVKSGTFILLLMVLFPCGAYAAKKDVSDPVLQEIIASFAPRLPRFIDKYNGGVFVADETITRGSLLLMLYEYDKSLKIPRKEYASQEEYDALRSRVAVLEKKERNGAQEGGGNVDIAMIINALEPNMGIILDNSLNNSKVFMSLKSEMASRPAPSGQGDMSGAQSAIEGLAKRIEVLETGSQSGRTAVNGDYVTSQEVRDIREKLQQLTGNIQGAAATPTREMAQMRRDMSEVTRRLGSLEAGMQSAMLAGAKDQVARRELEEVRVRLASVEKTAKSPSNDEAPKWVEDTRKEVETMARRLDEMDGRIAERNGKPAAGETVSAKKENAKMQNDLEDIRQQLSRLEQATGVKPSEIGELTNNMAKTKHDVAELEGRIEVIEASPRSSSSDSGGSQKWAAETRKEIEKLSHRIDAMNEKVADRQGNAETEKKLVQVNRRIDDIERNIASDGGAGGTRQYASGLGKIAVGLGMVAAFFIAR